MVGGIKCGGPTKACIQQLTSLYVRTVLWPVQHLSHTIHVAPSHSRDNLAFPPHQPIITVQPSVTALGTPLHPAPTWLHSPTRHPLPPNRIATTRCSPPTLHIPLRPAGTLYADEPVTSAITRSCCTSLEAARRVTSAIAVIGTCFPQPVAPKVYSRTYVEVHRPRRTDAPCSGFAALAAGSSSHHCHFGGPRRGWR